MLVVVIIDHDLFIIKWVKNLTALSNIGWIRDCITYFCFFECGECTLGIFNFVNAMSI